MILRRLGNKSAIADKIIPYFPAHKIYIEPFFGAGGMFFHKPKAKYNIVNDLDSDVFNLFQVVSNQKDELEQQFKMMPIHSDLLEYWKENQETEPIRRALRFLFISNLTFIGKGETLRLGSRNDKNSVYLVLNTTFDLIHDVQFCNKDFGVFLKSIEYRDLAETFIYSDPPYLETDNNYETSFTEGQSFELFEAMQNTGCKWAMSEFDHPFILQQAKERKLNVHIIGERQNLKNRRTEILVTNYLNAPTLFGWL